MTVTTDIHGRGAQNSASVGTSPAGLRLSSRRWRDPRLLVGILLVVCSAVGVVWVVNAADDRVAVWAVRGDLPAGSPVPADKLVDVDVQVPELSAYWTADDAVPEDLVALRDFASGELLTRANVEVSDASDVRIVTLPVLRNQMPADLDVGRRVDVYVVERGVSGEPDGPPQLVLRNAIVSSVDGDSGAFGGTSLEVGVALSLPQEQVPKVLDAQASGTLTLVDVPVATS
ncbi:MAG: hypothetical protein ACJ72Y_02950 [Actinomycetes bacterium]